MADTRTTKRSQKLGELSQLMGIYDRFSPRAKLEEQSLAEALGLQQSQRKQFDLSAPLQLEGMQTKNLQDQAQLQSFNDLAPIQKQQLMAQVQGLQQQNQLQQLTMGDAVKSAQARGNLDTTQAHVAQQTAPFQIEQEQLRAILGRGAPDAQRAQIAQTEEQTRGMQQQRGYDAQAQPLREQAGLAQIANMLLQGQTMQADLQRMAPQIQPIDPISQMQFGGQQVGQALPQLTQQPQLPPVYGMSNEQFVQGIPAQVAGGGMDLKTNLNETMLRIFMEMARNPNAQWPPQYQAMSAALAQGDYVGAAQALQSLPNPQIGVGAGPPKPLHQQSFGSALRNSRN